jgi:enamine deaminase RidA (YjgF/YER057c/UK114 family)
VSYVSQKPLRGMLNAEVVSVASLENVHLVYGENYLVLENGISRELMTCGILPPDFSASPTVQSNAVFSQIREILLREKFPVSSIVRQWNYIENISSFDGEHQNYQAFNDSRSHFYAEEEWSYGYPAATGIGTQSGGIMVEIIAFSGEGLVNKALNNPLQTAAHKYSQDVLLGASDPCFKTRTTPKFERGRIVGSSDILTIYISGTAAIRGETSLIADDVTEQTRITMENIDHLISTVNLPSSGVSCEYKLLRIYVKYPSHMEVVRTFMKANYPNVIKFYVCADICREELLVEIEGIASFYNFENRKLY